MNYSDKLKDPRWQKKRLEIFERDKWKCKICGENRKSLHIHHILYFPNKEPWEIHNGFLITLCKDCHELVRCPQEPCEKCNDFIGNKSKNFKSACWGSVAHEIEGSIGNMLEEIFEKNENFIYQNSKIKKVRRKKSI